MTDDRRPTPAQHRAPRHHGRHETADPHATAGVVRRGRSQLVFGALAVLLCLLLGVAIATQVRQTESGDSLETARPADLLVLLDSLQQREAALNTEVADLQRTLASLQASGSSDQAAIENAQARLAALSILIGTVAATGPGVTITIDDTAPGVSPETMLDVDQRVARRGRRGDGDSVRRSRAPCGSAWTPGWSARPARSSSTDHSDPAVFGSGHWRSAHAGRGDEHPRRRHGQHRAGRRHDDGAAGRPRWT